MGLQNNVLGKYTRQQLLRQKNGKENELKPFQPIKMMDQLTLEQLWIFVQEIRELRFVTRVQSPPIHHKNNYKYSYLLLEILSHNRP